MSSTDQIAAAAVRYTTAYRAAIVAHEALRDYWRSTYGPRTAPAEDDPSGFHGYGSCVRFDQYGVPVMELCELCEGSQDLHAARLAARKERGNALRSLLRLTKAAP